MKSLVEGGQSQNVVFLKSEKKLQDAIFHKETRLLISSCSGGPVIDALGAGVPLICVPLMVDQFYISQALQLEGKDHGRVSIALDTNKIMNDQKLAPQIGGEIGKTLVKPAEAIYEALDTILNKDEKKYLDEAHKLQKEMHKSAIQARADFLAAFRNSLPSQEEGHSGGSKVGGHGGHE